MTHFKHQKRNGKLQPTRKVPLASMGVLLAGSDGPLPWRACSSSEVEGPLTHFDRSFFCCEPPMLHQRYFFNFYFFLLLLLSQKKIKRNVVAPNDSFLDATKTAQ